MTRFGRTLAALLILLSAPRPGAADASSLPSPRFRSSQPELLAALAAGLRDSPTFGRLVDRLADSNVVVYLAYDRSPQPDIAAHVSFMAAAGGWRYVRVALDPRYRGCQRLGLLGHELQHVVEIAEAPGVVDTASMAALYRAIGFAAASRDGQVRFDSAAAIRAGRQIEREASGPPAARDGSAADHGSFPRP